MIGECIPKVWIKLPIISNGGFSLCGGDPYTVITINFKILVVKYGKPRFYVKGHHHFISYGTISIIIIHWENIDG